MKTERTETELRILVYQEGVCFGDLLTFKKLTRAATFDYLKTQICEAVTAARIVDTRKGAENG